MLWKERLKFYRTRRGLSQETVAARLNVTRQAVSKWETGGAEPDRETLARLAELYGVSVSTLAGEAPGTGGALPFDSLKWTAEHRLLRPQAIRTLGVLIWVLRGLGGAAGLLWLVLLWRTGQGELSLPWVSLLAFLAAAGCAGVRSGLEALHLELGEQMESMERRFRLLREQLRDHGA